MGRGNKKVTIEMLKKSLKDLKLPQSGNKDVLIQRLGWAELNSIETDLFMDQFVSNNVTNDKQPLQLKTFNRPIFKRIPKASRLQACIAYTKIVQNVIFKNDIDSWEKLLNFATCAIGGSIRGGKKKKSQATIINKRIEDFMSGNPQEIPVKRDKKPPTLNRCSCIMEKFCQPEKNQRGKVVFPDRREGG